MKFLISILILFTFSTVQAKTKIRTIAQAPKDKILTEIMNLSGGLVFNGGVSSVTRYQVKKYDEHEEQKRAINDFISNGGCADGGIKPRANLENNLKLLKKTTEEANGDISDPKSDAYKMLNLVQSLKDKNKFKALLSVSWDEKEENGESADGVKCSVYMFRLFTTDGQKLTLVYSITD